MLWVLCLFSMLRSVQLFQCLQLCYLFTTLFWIAPWKIIILERTVPQLHRLSLESVALTFSASPKAVAPACFIWFTVFDMFCENAFLWIVFVALTTQVKISHGCIWFQWFTQSNCPFISNVIHCFKKSYCISTIFSVINSCPNSQGGGMLLKC